MSSTATTTISPVTSTPSSPAIDRFLKKMARQDERRRRRAQLHDAEEETRDSLRHLSGEDFDRKPQTQACTDQPITPQRNKRPATEDTEVFAFSAARGRTIYNPSCDNDPPSPSKILPTAKTSGVRLVPRSGAVKSRRHKPYELVLAKKVKAPRSPEGGCVRTKDKEAAAPRASEQSEKKRLGTPERRVLECATTVDLAPANGVEQGEAASLPRERESCACRGVDGNVCGVCLELMYQEMFETFIDTSHCS